MSDINHNFSGDVLLSATGDLSGVDKITKSQQRVMRRLFTSPGTYIWNPSYGAGVPTYIGAPASELSKLKAAMISQMMAEESVAQNPPPEVLMLETSQSAITGVVRYTESSTQTLQTLTF